MAPTVDGHLAILAGIPLSFVTVTALRRFIKKRQNNPTLPLGPVLLPLVLRMMRKSSWSILSILQKPYWTSVLGLLRSTIPSHTRAIRWVREMVVNLVDDPQHYHNHFATFSLSVVMSPVYDYNSARDDPLVQIVIKALIPGFTLLTPDRTLMLKIFPFLLKLPDWCWGSSIKHNARASTERVNEMADVPFRYVQQYMVTSYETTVATLMVLVLAMVLYSDVQKRTQAKIDSVIGRDQLPTFEDRASLPYVDAVVRETFRWQPVVPLGVPHATSSDDVYDGYCIPKGTLHRMNSGNPTHLVLYQRGRYTDDASTWTAIVTMLTLDISSAKDDQGKVISFTPTFIAGVVRCPVIFPCNISARSTFIQTLWTVGEFPNFERDDSLPHLWSNWGTRGVVDQVPPASVYQASVTQRV
ncbi:cytochrome P450 [Suillus placidus]|uniref:Cytochrome P450 n=1 Tax=Suillus placidus TaxID=48579 RepID=A0A9P6ZTT5_9AGAM|nr:cytochrome P450 [Suillus placidus]